MAASAKEPRLETRRSFAPPLLIGVVSDTHLYHENPGNALPELVALFQRFQVDFIVHAGDANSLKALTELSAAAPLLAVRGNNDEPDVLDIAPDEIEFNAGGFRFAVLHGHGGKSARSEAKAHFGGKVDCVIYGHSHIPMIEKVDDTIFFNPGSAEQRRWHPHFGAGLIRVTAERIEPELILWEHPEDLRRVDPE